jgi:superfamily I DNA/RNA helicase
LNPVDAQFIDLLVAADIVTLVCGDDDQSLYSFRHATPDGFRSFPDRNDGTTRHELGHCFRCTPAVLEVAQEIIDEYAAGGRIDKTFESVWDTSAPRVGGVVSRVAYASDAQEARGIAEACLALIDDGQGLAPQRIAILVATRRLATKVEEALGDCGVPFLPLSQPQLDDSPDGRAGHALLKAICDEDDLVSRRVVFGALGGVGMQSCVDLLEESFAGAISAKQVWTFPDASAVYSPRV